MRNLSNTRRGATMIELLVAMSIFLVVSAAVVILMQHAQVVTVWGDKKNEALRSSREVMRRIGYVLRVATSRPAFDVNPAQPAIINVTTTARDTDPTHPPFPANHVEAIDFWTNTEDARRLVGSAAYPVPVYPSPMAFDPRSNTMDVPNNYSRLRLAWAINTGNITLELRSNDGAAVLATKNITNAGNGFNYVRTVDFRKDDATRSIGMFLETRSRDPNSRVAERRYSADTQFAIPSWN